VEEFSFAPWMIARARRLRIYRAIASIFWPLVAVILVLNLIRWVWPNGGATLALVLWLPFGIAMWLLGIPWLLLNWGFMFGLIKCPSCDSRFAPRISLAWTPRACQNCGFDIYTLRHPLSNNRLSGP
jgi:hypothetical protein